MLGAKGFRFRRRRHVGVGGGPSQSSNLDVEVEEGRLAIETHTSSEPTPSSRLFRRRCRLIIGITLLITIAIRHLMPSIIAFTKNIERPFEDNPHLRAKVFNPLRYFHAAFVDQRPRREARSFALRDGNAFVINLDGDNDLMNVFSLTNEPAMPFIKRFPAHKWIDGGAVTSTHNMQKIQIQKEWEKKYPFIKTSARNQKHGDAACTLSHLLLWKEKLIDAHVEYIFVFEDDVKIIDPFLHSQTIQAPDVADIVFLAPSALKQVYVPWQQADRNDILQQTDEFATRVIGGWGTQGYIITRNGAIKMIKHMEKSRDPIDIALFEAASVRIYLPASTSQWPAVLHTKGGSSRIGTNE